MSFIATLRKSLIDGKAVHDLSRNKEFSDFYFIGFKESFATIDFVTFVESDEITERQIVDLRDKFFNAVQAVSYDFGLRPMARNPNGLLAFIFQRPCPPSIATFIQKQSKASSFGRSAVIVAWAIDVPQQKIHTHNNPVSFLPPIVIVEKIVFPGLGFLKNVLTQHVERTASAPATEEESVQPDIFLEQAQEDASELGQDFAEKISSMEATIKEIFNIVSTMPDQPKYSFPNAQKVQIFERIDTYIENQAGIDQPELHKAVKDLEQKISALQRQYPQITTEAEATPIIEVELLEIKESQPLRWRNLLQLKRWLNGLKSGSFSVGEHFADETPWGKAALGFLEGFTNDIQ